MAAKEKKPSRKESNKNNSDETLDLNEDRNFRRAGYLIVIIVFFGLGGWAALAPIASAAYAPGKLRVESNRQTIQHLEGGIVKSLRVRDGDQVEKDQVVMVLDDTQSKSQLEIVQGQYYSALAREARLKAQRDLQEKITFPPQLLEHKDDRRVAEAIDVQEQTFVARNEAYKNEIKLYKQQVRQLNSQLKGLVSQKEASQRLLASFETEHKDLKDLAKKGFAERQQVRLLQREVSGNQGTLGDFVARIAATRSEVVSAKLQSLQLQKEMQREVAGELDTVQERLYQLVEQLQIVKDTLSRTVIRAPQTGIVYELAIHTVGAVIQQGAMLMEIVPQSERLIVEAQVSLLDIDRVTVGQQADINFSAFKSRETKKIQGRIINLSADSIISERNRDMPPYYLAIIEITEEGLTQLKDNDLELIAGMPADTFIFTGERTFLQYLTDPLLNTVARSFIED
jgi:epimerase transport system membrane fusion protein